MAVMRSDLEIKFEEDSLLTMLRKQWKLSREDKARNKYNNYTNIYNNTSSLNFIKKVHYALKARKWKKKLERRVGRSNNLKTNIEISDRAREAKAILGARKKANKTFQSTIGQETGTRNKFGCYDFSRPNLNALLNDPKLIKAVCNVIKTNPMAIATLPPEFLCRSESLKQQVTDSWKTGLKTALKNNVQLKDPATGRPIDTKEACDITKAYVEKATKYGKGIKKEKTTTPSRTVTDRDIDMTF